MLLRDRFDPRYFEPDVLFRYHAGWAGLSHTRASTATLIDRTGTLREVGPDVPRIDWSHGRPALRLEGSRTNLVAWSSKLSEWTKGGTPTVTDDAIAFGVLSLALVRDPTAGVLNYVFLPVTFTGDGQKCVSVYLAQGPNPGPAGTDIVLRDGTAGVDRLRARVTWSAGAPAVTMIAGTAITAPEHVGQGIYRLQFRSTAVTAANSHTVQIEPARQAETGDVYAGGVQVEDAVVPSSLIVTEGAAAARALDLAIAPLHISWQEGLAVYFRGVEAGSVALASEATEVSVYGGDTSIRIRSTTQGAGYSVRLVSGAAAANSAALAPPTIGQQIEHLLVLQPTGAYRLDQSIDGGPISSVSSAGVALLRTAATTVQINGLAGTANPGLTMLRDLIALRGASWTMDQVRAYLPEW